MAYYSLVRHGEHDPGCRYDFKNRAEQVIRDSRGTVVRDGEVYELRVANPDTVDSPDRSLPSTRGRPRARLQVSASDHQLTPSLNSAARIVRLLHDFDDDPEAVARFRAHYRGRTNPWDRFCRTTGELIAIGAILTAPQILQHSLALHGIVKTVRPTKGGDLYELCDDQVGYLDDPAGRRRLYVRVRSYNVDAFAGVNAGDRWLAYGSWELWRADHARLAEIQLRIKGPWSLATWRD